MKIPNFRILYHRIRTYFNEVFFWPLNKSIAINRKQQKYSFKNLRTKIPIIYQRLKNFDVDRFMTPFWKEKSKQLEDIIIPLVPFYFLRIQTINDTMFVGAGGKWMQIELKFLKKKISKTDLKEMLMEDYVGKPRLLSLKYFTSHNSIHQLYHIIRFLKKTNCNLQEVNTIIVWGGGYGNLAKIFWRFCKKRKNYIIIDLPLMSCIQWLYLSSIFGEKNVNLIQNSSNLIQSEKINLLPICFIDKYELVADLFISTWALTESSRYSQEYVLKLNWFDSKHFLLAYNYKSSRFLAIIIGEIAKKRNS